MANHVIKELHTDAEGNVIPHLKSITLPDGKLYYLKDEDARSEVIDLWTETENLDKKIDDMISGGVSWVGYASSITETGYIKEGTTTETKASNGNLVGVRVSPTEEATEYIFNGTAWEQVGGDSDLGDLAYKDSVSAIYTPAGKNSSSTVTFSASAKTDVLKADATFTTTKPNVNLATSGNTVDVVTAMPTATVPKTVAGTTKYIKPGTTTVPNVTAVKNVVKSWEAQVDDENLIFSRSYEDAVTLGTAISVMNGISSASSSSTGAVPYIDGVSISGTNSVSFGTPSKENVLKSTVTAELDAAPTTSVNTGHSVAAVTGNGTAAAQTFTGTEATITST